MGWGRRDLKNTVGVYVEVKERKCGWNLLTDQNHTFLFTYQLNSVLNTQNY